MKPKRWITAILMLAIVHIAGAQVISVMTYNIRFDTGNPEKDPDTWIFRKDFLGKQLLFYEPDVLGIQEGLHHQVRFIDSILADHEYAGVGRDDGKTAGEYSAIFFHTGKFKLISQSTFWLSETPDRPSIGWDASMERICTWVLLESRQTGKKFRVFNTHFDHKGMEARKNGARVIVERIESLNKEKFPVVLMGDMNLPPEHESILYLSGIFNDSRRVSEKTTFGPEGTFNGFRFGIPSTRRIDYIFTDRMKIRVYKYAVLNESYNSRYPSDHFPVFSEIEF